MWQEQLTAATAAALAAGAVLRQHWGRLNNITEKSPGNLVSEADTLAEQTILKILSEYFPEYAVLAEESGQRGTSQYTWAIDPLDGTTNFAHSYPFYAVSIGLLVAGVPTVGVIYDPARDELFSGATGRGAWLNGSPLKVSTCSTLAQSLLVTGFAYDRRQVLDNNYREFCRLTHLTQGVRRDGAAALDLAYIASGRLDGYWERGLSVWDVAAGVVLVQEAGGRVTAYDGSPLDLASGRVLATNGLLHRPVSTVLLEVQGQYIAP
ncbi:inositol monophosphatase family protein [Candidatus Cyanaurora vandensis]|uniref:inositol monophosphatase family protein n=1 Tax=Candidatus Cyanaurora vandensis TaxID=2714958 RepID=UPI00257FDF3B|nr:inositol monophosphatase family protein [Candidatus Cyanaurora vandensis]